MSTRANIKMKDEYNTQWFYRHSDGYPSGAMPTLVKFMNAINQGQIRRDCGQGGSWLILIGAQEYGFKNDYSDLGNITSKPKTKKQLLEGYKDKNDFTSWKVGAYELTNGQHGDIEYLYELDLVKGTIKYSSINWETDALEKSTTMQKDEIELANNNKDYNYK